jgi:hypothetical protein
MGDDTVGDVDGEVISRIARAPLRHEEKVPGSIIGRSSLRDGGQGNQTASDRRGKQKPLDHDFSEALSALPRVYGEEQRERLFKTASIVRDHQTPAAARSGPHIALQNRKKMAHPTRFQRVTFAFGGR